LLFNRLRALCKNGGRGIKSVIPILELSRRNNHLRSFLPRSARGSFCNTRVRHMSFRFNHLRTLLRKHRDATKRGLGHSGAAGCGGHHYNGGVVTWWVRKATWRARRTWVIGRLVMESRPVGAPAWPRRIVAAISAGVLALAEVAGLRQAAWFRAPIANCWCHRARRFRSILRRREYRFLRPACPTHPGYPKSGVHHG
jgi:hypothetical protein